VVKDDTAEIWPLYHIGRRTGWFDNGVHECTMASGKTGLPPYNTGSV
jgi:hypothetical protein